MPLTFQMMYAIILLFFDKRQTKNNEGVAQLVRVFPWNMSCRGNTVLHERKVGGSNPSLLAKIAR